MMLQNKQKNSTEITKVTEEQSSNYFEDVEYKGIDANEIDIY